MSMSQGSTQQSQNNLALSNRQSARKSTLRKKVQLERLEEQVDRLRQECDDKDATIRQLRSIVAWHQNAASQSPDGGLVWTNHSSTPWLGSSEPFQEPLTDARFHR